MKKRILPDKWFIGQTNNPYMMAASSLVLTIFPDGYQIMGAAVATMLSNVIAFIYFICVYQKLKGKTVLSLPRSVETVRRESLHSLFSVGIPAAMSLVLFDLTNIVINKLAAGHGDIELAAKNEKRMKEFFEAARLAGLVVSVICVVFYRVFAAYIIGAFISDADTVSFGTEFLQSRCFATPFMFLSFHMVHFMQAVDRGKVSYIIYNRLRRREDK